MLTTTMDLIEILHLDLDSAASYIQSVASQGGKLIKSNGSASSAGYRPDPHYSFSLKSNTILRSFSEQKFCFCFQAQLSYGKPVELLRQDTQRRFAIA